jgi:hypothetical protein|tara:strand:+ start:658 stop:1632 length:975 start_codon:yes stop_codon:yes gene_type:complete
MKRAETKTLAGAGDARKSTGIAFGFGAVALALHVSSRVRSCSRVPAPPSTSVTSATPAPYLPSAPPSTSVTSATPAQYLPCKTFQGTRPGYFFRLDGAQGPGYYVDRVAQSSAATSLVSPPTKKKKEPQTIVTPWTHVGKNDKTTAEDRALLALMDRMKDLYLRYVNHFLEEGAKHHKNLGKEPPTFVVRKNIWDLQCAQLRKFLELAQKHGASESDPRVLFGYHGTSAENADKIFLEGFSPKCRRCQGAGAYFSGHLDFSAVYAGANGAKGDILLVALLLDGHRSAPIFGDQNLRGHAKPLINVQACVFGETYAMPLARLRGF